MRFKLILLTALTLGFSTTEIAAQCSQEAKIKEYSNKANSVSTKESSNNSQGYRQYAGYYANLCYCEAPRTDEELKQLVTTINASVKTINNQYSSLGGRLLQMTISKCKGMYKGDNSGGQTDNKTATQREIENRFKNYNTAMNLKGQGEAIAKAYAEQVKQYGQMGYAANPQEQLDMFNQNMVIIAQLQSQNKADNLNQLDNTLGTALNQLNAGNGEGALFSTLSLLDQVDAQKDAKREALEQKQKLISQQQQKMSAFYLKANVLNNQAIESYYKSAAYSFSEADEILNLKYVKHHECFADHMKSSYSYNSTGWTKNPCQLPINQKPIINNLMAKDIQYINAAERKYNLFNETGLRVFRTGAMKFAGLAANTNPKVEYFYLMGHYAGVENPIVAFTSFETVKSLEPEYFSGAKAGEYYLVNLALQKSFKEAINSNNQELIKEVITSRLHTVIKIEDQPAIRYAIKVDQPDVIQLFLNDNVKGKSQSIINTKVQEVIMMAAVLDAPNTIQRLIDLGFSVDFEMNGATPSEVADQSVSIYALDVLENNSNKRVVYDSNSETMIVQNLLKSAQVNELNSVETYWNKLHTTRAKEKVILELLKLQNRSAFLWVVNQYSASNEIFNNQENADKLTEAFYLELANARTGIAADLLSLEFINIETACLDDLQTIEFLDFINNNLTMKWTKERNLIFQVKDGYKEINRRFNNGDQYKLAPQVQGMYSPAEQLQTIVNKFTPLKEKVKSLLSIAIYNQDVKLFWAVYNKFPNSLSCDWQNIYQIGFSNLKKILEVDESNLELVTPTVFSYYCSNALKTSRYKEAKELIDFLIINGKSYGKKMDKFYRFNDYGQLVSFDRESYMKDPYVKKLITKEAKKDKIYWNAIFSGDYEKRYK